MKSVTGFLTGLALLAFAGSAIAQQSDWPNKPVNIVIGFNPGVTDIVTRIFAEEFQRELGQPFVIDNRPGASGSIAASQVAKGDADGYTLLAVPPAHTVLPAFRELDFDVIEDFAPITVFGAAPNVLVVKADSPFQTFDDYLAALKDPAQNVSYSSSGIGTTTHLTGAMLEHVTDSKIIHVPYKSGSESVTALLGGHVSSVFSSLNLVLPLVKSGDVRILAVAAEARSPILPEVPTMAERGVENMIFGTWFGLLAPKAVPAEVVEKLSAVVDKALASDSLRTQFSEMAIEPLGLSPEAFRDLMQREVASYRKLVDETGLKLQ